MAQYNWGTMNPLTQTGVQLCNDLNLWKDAVNSCHLGTTRPTYLNQGGMWLDSSVAGVWTLKFCTSGVAGGDVIIGTINTTTPTWSFTSGSFSGNISGTTASFSGQITSTVATGTAPFVITSTTPVANLSIGGNAATATNLIGGNGKEVPIQLSNGITTFTPSITGKNIIINGSLQVWQRGASFSVVANTASSYTADRWSCRTVTCAATVTRQVTTDNSSLSIRAQRNSGEAAGSIFLEQAFETEDIRKLRSNTITVSFIAKTGSTFTTSGGVLNARIYYGTGTERVRGATVYTSETSTISVISASTTEQVYSFTSTVPAGTTQMELTFVSTYSGTGGLNDWFEVTNIQIERGSTPTYFESRSYGTELSLCQRYYQLFDAMAVGAYPTGVAGAITGNSARFIPEMRAAPTITAGTNGTTSNSGTPTINFGTYYTTNARSCSFHSAQGTASAGNFGGWSIGCKAEAEL